MKILRVLLPVLLAILPLQGCKVPDIKPFAGATTQMTSALREGFGLAQGNLDAATAPLDEIATNAIIALALDNIAEALAAIHKANTDLQKQTGLINGVTKQAHADGRKRGMEHANQLLADAKPALKALRKANNALGKPDAKTTQKIDEVIKAIEGLTG